MRHVYGTRTNTDIHVYFIHSVTDKDAFREQRKTDLHKTQFSPPSLESVSVYYKDSGNHLDASLGINIMLPKGRCLLISTVIVKQRREAEFFALYFKVRIPIVEMGNINIYYILSVII